MSFSDKLRERKKTTGGILCIGLDPDVERMPANVASDAEPLYTFCREIVSATSQYTACYKPNLAFFEAYGSKGIAQLERLLTEIPSDIPTILDAKRSDIGNTARHYARFLYEHLNGDAVTITPFLGRDSLDPFFDYPDKIPFVLCLTSNPGSKDIQLAPSGEGRIYHRIIDLLQRIGKPHGLVVGAQHTNLLQEVRRLVPEIPLLIPGVGAQGGSLADTVTAATVHDAPAVINVSRDILYASSNTDFALKAADRARFYVDEMKALLHSTR